MDSPFQFLPHIMSWEAAWDMPAAPSDYQAPAVRVRGPSDASMRDQAVAPPDPRRYTEDTHHPSNPAQYQQPALVAAQSLALPAAPLPAQVTGHVYQTTQPIPIPRRADVEYGDMQAGSYGPDRWSQQDCALSYNAATASFGDRSNPSSIGASGAQSMTPATDGRVTFVAYPSSTSTTPLSVDSGVFPALTPPTDSPAPKVDYDKLVDMNDISGSLDRLGIDFSTLASSWAPLPFQDGYDADEDIGATSSGISHEPDPTAASTAPVTDPQPVDPAAQLSDPALYAQQTYEDVYSPPVCLSAATAGTPPLQPGYVTSLADYDYAATRPYMHPPSDDQGYALEAQKSSRLALIARPAPGPLVPSGSTKRRTRDSSEERALGRRSRKRVVRDSHRGDDHPSLEDDANAQWARMPEDLRRKWSEAMAAQQLGSASGATTRRSRLPYKDASLSSAYESRASALRQDTHVISRAPPTAPMLRRGRAAPAPSRAQSRSRRVERHALHASTSQESSTSASIYTPTSNSEAPLDKPRKRRTQPRPGKSSPRPIHVAVDAYRVCVWHGCRYKFPRDVFGIFDWAEAIVDHWKVNAKEADLEVDPNYRKKGGMCERQKREGDVSCHAHVPGLNPCHWKGRRGDLMQHARNAHYGLNYKRETYIPEPY